MPNITITLEKAVVGHKAHKELTVREPVWREFMKFGPAYRWVPRGDGALIPVPDNEVIERYAEACLVAPGEPETLSQLNLADAYKVVDYFLGFGLAAETVAAEWKMSLSTSSKSGNGDQQTSQI